MNNAGQERISEGFRLAQSERAVPGGDGAKGSATPASHLSVSEFPFGELTRSVERRNLSLAFEPKKEKSSWECNRYKIGH